MSPTTGTQRIEIVTACMHRDGVPTFARTEVELTADQADNGVQFYLAEAELLQRGFEEPFVHFTAPDSPAFLFPAVEQWLGTGGERTHQALSEGP